jgi:hypothetical protein
MSGAKGRDKSPVPVGFGADPCVDGRVFAVWLNEQVGGAKGRDKSPVPVGFGADPCVDGRVFAVWLNEQVGGAVDVLAVALSIT